MTDAPSPSPPLGRRLATATRTLAIVAVVPAVIAFVVGGPTAAGGAVLGAVLAFLLALLAGWRRSLLFIVPMIGAAALSAVTSGTAWWVLGLGVLGLLAGALSARGLVAPVALVGIAWSVSKPTDPPADLLVLLLFATITAAYAVLVARRLGLPGVADAVRLPPRRVALATVGLTIAATAAGVMAQHWDNENAYWLPMTVFVLAIPAPGTALSERALTRVLGTAAGVGAALVILGIITSPVVLYGLAFVGMTLTLAVPTPRWFNAATVAAGIVLALSPTSESDIAGSRLGATALAAALVVLTASTLALVARVMPSSSEQRDQVAEFEKERRRDESPPPG